MNFEGPQPHSPPLKTKLKRRYEVDNETKIKSNRLERQTHLKSFLCRVAPRWVGGWVGGGGDKEGRNSGRTATDAADAD